MIIMIIIMMIIIRLRIAETRADHAGNFTCSPPHTVADSIRLSVSTGHDDDDDNDDDDDDDDCNKDVSGDDGASKVMREVNRCPRQLPTTKAPPLSHESIQTHDHQDHRHGHQDHNHPQVVRIYPST